MEMVKKEKKKEVKKKKGSKEVVMTKSKEMSHVSPKRIAAYGKKKK